MNSNLTSKQALAIYSMAFGATDVERSPLKSKLNLDKAPRDELVGAGLLELEKVKPQGERVLLTEAGWRWASEHLDVELKPSPSAARVLQNVLTHLRLHLGRSGGNLAEFIMGDGESAPHPAPANDAAPPPPKPHDASSNGALERRIRDTCLSLTGGATRTRVRLSELRGRLTDVPRERLDQALLELQQRGALVLYRIDDPNDIKPADRKAALQVAGNPRHIVYLES